MFKIIRKQKLNVQTTKIDVQADIIVPKWQPGQHVMVMADALSKRLVFNTVDVDRSRGVLSIVFQENTPSTIKLGQMKIGQDLYALLGPLGVPFQLPKRGRVICVAEDVQAAAILPICRELKAKKHKVCAITSFANRKAALLEMQLRVNSSQIIATNREESYYKKVLWQEALTQQLFEEKINLVYADGSLLFLEEVAQVVRDFEVPLQVNLLSSLFDDDNVFDTTAVRIGRRNFYVNTEGLMVDGAEVNYRALLKQYETQKEYERCLKDNRQHKNPKSGLKILPKLFGR